ncbi:25b3026b-87b6-4617-8e5b-8d7445e5aa53 [Thermothielavioides terrestris]|uniref:25b3026b-87b6-4617-8e5b-8d7445e5aa53 n=1 Tax=Thermothielavioides terrestris TaxID=2587410 RepID=A0A3S4D942_9PEZI|nr:25b3026b-87b6-4617-8e5b-8d7445e5aa53 [Thermothielavioides terrestris]
MVYCGKPSKGCSNCRVRKIRGQPGCGQCAKRQLRCPGYRNLVDLMFRDESEHVREKHNARTLKKAAKLGLSPPATPSDSEGRLSATPEPRVRKLSLTVPPSPVASSSMCRDSGHHDDGSMLMSPESGSWPVTPPMAQVYNLAPACQEHGLAYFFSRYVNAEETVSHQKFDFLTDVWKPSSSLPERQVDGVLASMTAVGLMGFAGTTRSPELMDAARKSYGAALRLINHALQDPAEAVKDSTMLSVLILGVFEMMTENPSRTPTVEAFQDHVNGAALLARMRGPAQFRTRAGRRMFSMLCQRVIISCIQRSMPMPEYLIELWHEMSRTSDAGNNPDKRLMPLLWQVLQLRYEIKSGDSPTDPETIVERLLTIDREFENLTAQLPASWKYRTFKVKQQHPAVFGGICRLYSSPHHANVWNYILTTRILLLETVLSTVSQSLTSFPAGVDATRYLDEYHKARRKLKHLVRDVVASVPQQLGLMNAADGSIDSADGDSPPIATVEILQTPSPPTSPSARSTASSSSDSASTAAYSPLSATPEQQHHLSHTRQHQHTASSSSSLSPSGLTVLDVTRARDREAEAERYMLLASATSAVVWPLFVVGMSTAAASSSSSSLSSSMDSGSGGSSGNSSNSGGGGGNSDAEMRAYVVGRLRTLYMETGIRQADAVANLLEEEYAQLEEGEPPAAVVVAAASAGAGAGPGGNEGWMIGTEE